MASAGSCGADASAASRAILPAQDPAQTKRPDSEKPEPGAVWVLNTLRYLLGRLRHPHGVLRIGIGVRLRDHGRLLDDTIPAEPLVGFIARRQ